MRWITTCSEAMSLFLDGDLDGAEALATEALELGLSSGQPDALSYYGSQLWMIRRFQGRRAELEDLVRQQVDSNPGIPSFRVALAVTCADNGRPDEAIDLLTADLANGFVSFPRDPMWLVNLAGVVNAITRSHAARPGATAIFARPIYDILAPWSSHLIVIGVNTLPRSRTTLGCWPGFLATIAMPRATSRSLLRSLTR